MRNVTGLLKSCKVAQKVLLAGFSGKSGRKPAIMGEICLGSDKMKIRILSPKDNEALWQIIRHELETHKLALPGTAYTDPELAHLSDYYDENPQRKYFVVVNNDETEVLGGAGFAEYDAPNKIAELQKLYLAPKAKGQGLGYQLIAVIEKEAKKAGYQKLYLETHHNLQAALHIYRKVGFKQLPQPLHPGIHTTMDYFFIKTLD